MGQLAVSMAIFNGYFDITRGYSPLSVRFSRVVKQGWRRQRRPRIALAEIGGVFFGTGMTAALANHRWGCCNLREVWKIMIFNGNINYKRPFTIVVFWFLWAKQRVVWWFYRLILDTNSNLYQHVNMFSAHSSIDWFEGKFHRKAPWLHGRDM